MGDAEVTTADRRRFTLRIHDENDGMLWADVEELPGCFASGSDLNELLEAAAEAIGMYLSDSDESVDEPVAESGDATLVPWPGARSSSRHYAVDRAEILLEA